MYDKVKIIGNSIIDIYELERNTRLTGIKTEYSRDTGILERITGRLKTLRVEINGNWLNISGSLPKFKNNENITPFTLSDTRDVIEEIGDLLHIDMRNTFLTEMEFGANIITDNKVANYLQCLGDRPYYERGKYPHSVYYENKSKSYENCLIFYDKFTEAKKKGMIIPEQYQAANILRVEVRRKKRLAIQTGAGQSIDAIMLYNPQFYNSQKLQLIKDYQSIKKRANMEIDYTSIRKPSDCKDVLLAYLAEQNPSIVAQFMENVKTAGVFDRQQMRRAKESIMEGCKNGITLSNDLIKELDSKIMAIADYD